MKSAHANQILDDTVLQDSRRDILIEESECHILTFSEEAIALEQSANYIVGPDIALHIIINREHSGVVINNSVSGTWQEQSIIYVPNVQDASLQVAVLFKLNEILVAVVGNTNSRIVIRKTDVVSIPVQINLSELIGFSKVIAPARLPAGKAVLDFFGLFPDGSTVLCGWLSQSWPDSEELYVNLTIEDVRFRLPSNVLWYSRPDLDNKGIGYILSFSLPPELEINPATLLDVKVDLDQWSYDLSPHSHTKLLDAEHARSWMAEVLPRIRKGNIPALREIISRPVFSGTDTLSSLSVPCHIETDLIYAVPGKGLLLLGWFLDPMVSIRSIRICSGRSSSMIDFRDSLLSVERLDVKTAYDNQYDLADANFGFIAFSPLIAKPGSSVYAEVELTTGEVGFKPLGSPIAAGIPAIRRVLQNLNFTSDEVQAAFDTVLGESLIAINRARLAKRMPVAEIRFGAIPETPRCSIVVPLYGRLDFLEYQCALFSKGGIEQDELIYVLDEPARKAELLELANTCNAKFGVPIRVILPGENRGFGPASNLGLEYSKGHYVCFLNSDIFPAEVSWLDKLVSSLKADPEIGTVGALCLFADGSIQHAGMDYEPVPRFAGWMFPKHPGKGMKPPVFSSRLADAPGVTGACMLMHRTLAKKLGGFDADYVVGDFEDADLCNRIKAKGLRCVVDREVVLYHLERQSQGNQSSNWRMNLTLLNAWTFNNKWHGK